MAAVEREIPAWQWMSRPPASRRVAAESQNRLDVPSLGRQNVRVRLDRVVKAEGGAKVRIERLERLRVGPFRVEDRQNMRDASTLVAMSSSSPQIAKAGKDEGFMGVPLA